MRSIVSHAALALVTAATARADQAPDLSRYDCTLVNDGKTVRGDELAKAGFEIGSVGRFGQPNVMMIDRKSKARANCIARGEAQK